MSEPKMTAEERIAKHTIRVAVQYCEDEEFVEPEDAVEACKAHASEAVEPWKARVAELERERDAARALSNSLLLDIGQIAEAIESKASEPSALLADAQALKARVAELEAERDKADRVRRNAALAINIATAAMYEAQTKREAAEARIRELEREVKRLAALGKEAQP